METNKEKAIREAYGTGWDIVSNHHQYDGWIYSWAWNFNHPLEMEKTDDGNGKELTRPKSLQGIENNNCWIAINSEDDLPKNSCSCWIDVNGHVSNTPFWYNYGTTQFSFNDIIYNFSNVKAYQIAIQPLKRIY